MTASPNFFKTAMLSNSIAYGFTGSILGIWYLATSNSLLAAWLAGFTLIPLALAWVIDWLLVRFDRKEKMVDISLKSEANQWAPIAGASMIVGWSALKTNFATHEGALLVLIGLLYSLWCIVLAEEAAESRSTHLVLKLLFSHLICPAAIGLVAAILVNNLTKPTSEEARQDACYNAYETFRENQCKPVEPLDAAMTERPTIRDQRAAE